jgi:hypothetical protein
MPLLNANADKTMPTNNLPEKLILRLEIDMDQEWAREMLGEDTELTLENFVESLQIAAGEYFRDNLFNMIQTAKILDENENPIFEDEEDED